MKRTCVLALLSLLTLSLIGCAGSWGNLPDKPNVVNMTGAMRYDPAEITVKTGETVHWKNTSIVPHTVTADPALAKHPADVSLPAGVTPFNSGTIKSGGTFSHVFTVPGTYKYFCIPHESMGMVGVVVVRPLDVAAPSPPRPNP